MPAEHEANLPAPGPDWGLRNHGRMPDRGPRYTETPADPAAPDAPLVAEPFNAVTASFFIVIVAYWVWRLRGRYRLYPFLSCCLPILLAGGIGGTVYHGTRRSTFFFLMDIIPISVLGLAGAIYLAVRLTRRWAWLYILGSVGVYVAANELLFQVIKPSIMWAVGLSYATLAAIVITFMVLVLVKTRFRYAGWAAAGVVAFGIAFFFRQIDDQAARLLHLRMGTHWLWHTFGAAAVAFVIEYFYRVEGEGKVAVNPPAAGVEQPHQAA